MRYVIGNWKANKSEKEVMSWVERFAKIYRPTDGIEVVLCPPFVYLPILRKQIEEKEIKLSLGAQDISAYNDGSYTGEVTPRMLSTLTEYVLIGHSERRKHQNETDTLIAKKAQRAAKYRLKTIVCVQSTETPVPERAKFVAYEPIEAIGSNKPADPEEANSVIKHIKQSNKNLKAGIYGGSVNAENVSRFLSQPDIDGVLPGGASLDPLKFSQIIVNASEI